MLLRAFITLFLSVLSFIDVVRACCDNPQGIVEKPMQWSLDNIPNPNTTDHLVFETVYSLLQYWPNYRMRNGHNIVPGFIPEGTLLYHGTSREEVPPGPDWVAFDPDHAHYYCRERKGFGPTQQGCWQLTLTTTRPLKVVYFDGESAAKFSGPLDTQDLLAFGEIRAENTWEEVRRSEALCGWGQVFGVDGFVRMEMDFEVILCDFTSGVNLVTFSNIVRALGLPSEISANRVMFEVLNAGAWHNHFPGETRIRLDLAELISFYDTELVPSLVGVRAGQERWDHRVQDVSKADLSAVVSRLEVALSRPSRLSSGIEWRTLVQIIIDQYAGRLELIQHLFASSLASVDDILDLAVKTQTQLRVMLAPYIHLSAVPTNSPHKTAFDWTVPIYRDCATAHTIFAESRLDSMTDSEKLLLRAIRGTNQEICRVLTRMWATGVHAGIDPLLTSKDSVDIAEAMRIWNVWAEDLDRLMAWLDWNVWVKCKPSCGPEEMCFLHVWPFQTHPPWGHVEGRASEPGGALVGGTDGFAEEPYRPQPKCISLVDP